MRRLFPTLLLGLCLLGPSACRQRRARAPKATAVAFVRAPYGEVTVQDHGSQRKSSGCSGQPLEREDIISTGADGRVQVEFVGGTSLTLGPNTSLVLRPLGGTSATYGAVLLRGEVLAKTQPGAQRVAIKTPLGVAQLSTRLSEMVLSADKGIKVAVGEIDVVDGHAEKKTLRAGQSLAVDGLSLGVQGPILDIGAPSLAQNKAPSLSIGALSLQSQAAARLAIGAPELQGQATPEVSIGAPLLAPQAQFSFGAPQLGSDATPGVALGPVALQSSRASLAIDALTLGSTGGLTAKLAIGAPAMAEQAAPRFAPPAVKVKPLLQSFKVVAPPRGAQLSSGKSGRWQMLGRSARVRSGESLRALKKPVQILFGNGASMTLAPHARIDFSGPKTPAQGATADYTLRQGTANLLLPQNGNSVVAHTLHVGGTAVVVRPTGQQAELQVGQDKHGAVMALRHGRVTLSDNAQVEAGTRLSFAQGKLLHVDPLQSYKVDVHGRTNAVVYFRQNVPPLNFVWGKPAPMPQLFELAQDADFRRLVVSERISRGSFIVDRLAAGRYFWRVDKQPQSRGLLRITEEHDETCVTCRRLNTIPDVGGQTMVVFQEKLPDIVLNWQAGGEAAAYNLRIFRDGALENALVDQRLTGLSSPFVGEQALREGTYFWSVTQLDKNGHPLRSGRINVLTIAYENAVSVLSIHTPRQNQLVQTDHILATGTVEPGGALYIGSDKVVLDRMGRFARQVSLQPGRNQLVFRTVARDGVERLYLRDVVVR